MKTPKALRKLQRVSEAQESRLILGKKFGEGLFGKLCRLTPFPSSQPPVPILVPANEEQGQNHGRHDGAKANACRTAF